MNHIFQTSVILMRVMEYIERNWLCKHMKKVKSNQEAILVLEWVKHSFSLWISLKANFKLTTRATLIS